MNDKTDFHKLKELFDELGVEYSVTDYRGYLEIYFLDYHKATSFTFNKESLRFIDVELSCDCEEIRGVGEND